MLYFILKLIFKIALRVFFRQIEVRNKNLIPANGPLLVASNHPNTFMDPIAIAAIMKQEVFFIAKGTVFNTPLKRWLLQQMNLIPVYRREDGAVPEASNNNTFRKCITHLHQSGTLLIFPEGNSYNERRLRPLKTGTARMALAAEAEFDFKAGVQIVPIGLNYTDPTRFQSNLFINIGEAIPVAHFADIYKQDSFKAAQQLSVELRSRLEKLVVITATPADDNLVEQIERIYKTNLAQELGLSKKQADKFVMTKAIADSISYFNQHEPERVQVIKEKIDKYNQELEKLGLQDKYLNVSTKTPNLVTDSLTTLFYLALGLPLYIWGIITNYLPYIIPSKIADNLTGEQEFRAPIMMTAGIFTFSFFYLFMITSFYLLTTSALATFIFACSLPLAGFFALHYTYRLGLTRGYLKLFTIFYNWQTFSQVWQQREDILLSLENAKTIYQQHLAKELKPATIKPENK